MYIKPDLVSYAKHVLHQKKLSGYQRSQKRMEGEASKKSLVRDLLDCKNNTSRWADPLVDVIIELAIQNYPRGNAGGLQTFSKSSFFSERFPL